MNKSFYLRHEDFNWSIFDLEKFLLEHSDLGYSCFLYEDPCYQCFLIETVKYSRKCLVVTSLPIWAQQDSMHVMLGIWQCNRVVKGTVNTSCLYEGTERVMCGRCCLAFRRVNRCFSFLWKRITDTWSLFFLKFCHCFDKLVSFLLVVQFCL